MLSVASLAFTLVRIGWISRTFGHLSVVLTLGELGLGTRCGGHARVRLVGHLAALTVNYISTLLLLNIVKLFLSRFVSSHDVFFDGLELLFYASKLLI